MVCEHVEVTPFQDVPETFDGEVNSLEFMIIGYRGILVNARMNWVTF